MTNAEATRLHTQFAVAWLWHVRGCRVIADEVGVGMTGSRLAMSSATNWRADVVGVRPGKHYSNRPEVPSRFDVVEVKGHRRDWRRELPKSPKCEWSDIKPRFQKYSKWGDTTESAPLALWLLVSHTVTDDDLSLLPIHWGVLRASDDVLSVETVRKAKAPGVIAGHNDLLASWGAVASRSRSPQLPTMTTRATDHEGKI